MASRNIEAATPDTDTPVEGYREARAQAVDVLVRARHQMPTAAQHLDQHLQDLLQSPEAAALTQEARAAVERLRASLATLHTHLEHSVRQFEAAVATTISAYDKHQSSDTPGTEAPVVPSLSPIAIRDLQTFAGTTRSFRQASDALVSQAWAPKMPGIPTALAKEIGGMGRQLRLHGRRMRTAAHNLDARVEAFRRDPQAPSRSDRETADTVDPAAAAEEAPRTATTSDTQAPALGNPATETTQRRLLVVVSNAESVMDVNGPAHPVAPTTPSPRTATAARRA